MNFLQEPNEVHYPLIDQIESKGVAAEEYAEILDNLIELFDQKKNLTMIEIREAFEVEQN